MTSILGRIFGTKNGNGAEVSRDSVDRAIEASDELIGRMRAAAAEEPPVQQMVAELFDQQHNAPYILTVFEAHQEMNAAVRQRR